jgi:hypothetical protein
MIMNGSTTHIKVIFEYEETDEVCFFIKKAVKKTSDFLTTLCGGLATLSRQHSARVTQ